MSAPLEGDCDLSGSGTLHPIGTLVRVRAPFEGDCDSAMIGVCGVSELFGSE